MMSKEERKAYNAAYYQRNREKLLGDFREWKVANRAKHRATSAKWQLENRDKSRLIKNIWKKRNPEIVRKACIRKTDQQRASHTARQRVRRLKIEGSNDPFVRFVYELAASNTPLQCFWCGKEVCKQQRQVDHVIPLKQGGAHNADNLAIACSQCNLSKGSLHPLDFLQRRFGGAS